MAGAAYLLYRIAVRLFDRDSAILAVLVFACLPSVTYAASDARPYALALLIVNASMLLLLKWLDTGDKRIAAAYVVMAALILYAHYLFAPILLMQGLYA